jgi:hypothetical protein
VPRRQRERHEQDDEGPAGPGLDTQLRANTRGHERVAVDGDRERRHRGRGQDVAERLEPA